jgi:hypothetical protein
MKMEVEVPADFQGPVTGELNKRRGLIISTETVGNTSTIVAEVPLAETFGYSTDLRSMTQGQGVFTMEFSKYRPPIGQMEREGAEWSGPESFAKLFDGHREGLRWEMPAHRRSVPVSIGRSTAAGSAKKTGGPLRRSPPVVGSPRGSAPESLQIGIVERRGVVPLAGNDLPRAEQRVTRR